MCRCAVFEISQMVGFAFHEEANFDWYAPATSWINTISSPLEAVGIRGSLLCHFSHPHTSRCTSPIVMTIREHGSSRTSSGSSCISSHARVIHALGCSRIHASSILKEPQVGHIDPCFSLHWPWLPSYYSMRYRSINIAPLMRVNTLNLMFSCDPHRVVVSGLRFLSFFSKQVQSVVDPSLVTDLYKYVHAILCTITLVSGFSCVVAPFCRHCLTIDLDCG